MQAAELSALRGRLAPYAVSGVLGEGGSAIVYAAEHDGLLLALKVPRESALSDKEAQRFLDEAKMLERVSHPSIAQVVASGLLDDGTPYLAMQRYAGETLAQRLAGGGPLGVELALSLFEQVADATCCLHDAGLVHRDLKAENVVLLAEGTRAVLLDFGIAKDAQAPASTTTQSGVARGTPATMAPERFFGAPATIASDVYELAVLLYAMLVGRLPWTDVTNVEARLNPEPPGPDVPSALSTVILRALSTRPERRPRSAAALLSAVQEAAGGVGPKSGRVTAATAVQTPQTPKPDAPAAMETAASDGAQVLEGPPSRPDKAKRRAGPLLAVGTLLGGALLGLGAAKSFSGEPPRLQAALATVPAGLLGRVLTMDEAESPAPAPAPTPASSASSAPSAPRSSPPRVAKPAGPLPPLSSAPAPNGKPRGATCTRSSECASMICAADKCQ
jgi:serine/threonine-protein kinase